MRSILALIALACIPAFCQDTGQKPIDMALHPLLVTLGPPAPQLCSIPLLNAAAPGKPVPMPTLKPGNEAAIQHPPDRMNIPVPAPACKAPAPATKP